MTSREIRVPSVHGGRGLLFVVTPQGVIFSGLANLPQRQDML